MTTAAQPTPSPRDFDAFCSIVESGSDEAKLAHALRTAYLSVDGYDGVVAEHARHLRSDAVTTLAHSQSFYRAVAEHQVSRELVRRFEAHEDYDAIHAYVLDRVLTLTPRLAADYDSSSSTHAVLVAAEWALALRRLTRGAS